MSKRDDTIRVFIVDDSAVFRHKLIQIITESHSKIRVIGTAPNGAIALKKLKLPKYSPHIILMDIIMPGMDGFETIRHIIDIEPLPVIIVSSLNKKEINIGISNLGMAILETGAVEFIKKPDPRIHQDLNRFKNELIKKISELSKVNLTRAFKGFDFKAFLKEDIITEEFEPIKIDYIIKEIKNHIIVIGASTGGPRAISLILSKIAGQFPPIIIIQHMPVDFISQWTIRLQNLYPELKIKSAENKEIIKPNYIYIAPGGKHCAIMEGRVIELYKGERVNFVIPAIDITLKTASQVYKSNILGIILTGMGKDGLEGARAVKSTGGKIFVEHESTAVIFSMPRVIILNKLSDKVIPLHNIPRTLKQHGYILS